MPEGYIRSSTLKRRVDIRRSTLDDIIDGTNVQRAGKLLFDSSRLNRENVKDIDKWSHPTLPGIGGDGKLRGAPITERIIQRDEQIERLDDEAARRIMVELADTPGYAIASDICNNTDDELALENLLDLGMLKYQDEFIYDPLRLSANTMQEVCRRHELEPFRREIVELLESRPGNTAPMHELEERFTRKILVDVMNLGGLTGYSIKTKKPPHRETWVRLKEIDEKEARKAAEESTKIKDSEWEPLLRIAGEVVRPGARDGNTNRVQVVARSYTMNSAAKRLALKQPTLEAAVAAGIVEPFTDPEGKERFPAYVIEEALEDVRRLEEIAGFEEIKVRELATVAEVGYSTMRRRLGRRRMSRSSPAWRDVRGKWGLPQTLHEFRTILRAKIEEERRQRAAELAEEQRILEEQREAERQQREALRQRLVNAFPTWRHADRSQQRVYLHIGPPNSGKTYDALERLKQASAGWYLAPLRLLAYEVFDRLNHAGVLCSLLTGEEHIPVPGATVTAATIEMFNPGSSGDVVIIDEAQMLADKDRGWAWTRALMEAKAPEIHVIGPSTAQHLIERMAGAAEIPVEVIKHERLAPIRVADKNTPIDKLPPRAILVAFSRRTVLHLKTELEQLKRSVSVVYGSLPPEVRRRQADRFANGETDICIATDAVGMGLNLPADYVCFYELDKFDGVSVRPLKPSEVQQIGGRAGRYGYSQSGEIMTTRRRDMKTLRKLFYTEPEELTHARVAPTVEDLEMIPGSLWERLLQWAQLQSIPDSLREVINTADLMERVELARMLTDEEVEELGMDAAIRLINAPTRQSSRSYWRQCASAILNNEDMPHPPYPQGSIENSADLETMEICISCADIYLWLANRREFSVNGSDMHEIHALRKSWGEQIDDALLRRLDTARRCPKCGKPLPLGHRHRLCDECFFGDRFN